MNSEKDHLFTSPRPRFQFNQEVANVFDNMINRSVPHYSEIQQELAWLVDHLIQGNTTLYDLGCSTGATYHALLPTLNQKKIQYIGIDNSDAMLTKVQHLPSTNRPPKWLNHDLNSPFEFQPSQIVILNLVLQFIQPKNKLALLTDIRKSLLPSGHLLLVEKITPAHYDLFTNRYYQFKTHNGYSQDEIINKQNALKDVLVPQSLADHHAQLKEAGFTSTDVFFQWYNFAGILASTGQ